MKRSRPILRSLSARCREAERLGREYADLGMVDWKKKDEISDELHLLYRGLTEKQRRKVWDCFDFAQMRDDEDEDEYENE